MKLSKITGLNYNTSNLRVCIDSVEDNKISGRVYSMRLTSPIRFGDITDFILKLETVLDIQNYPQSFQRKRLFRGTHAVSSPYIGDNDGLDEETVVGARGELYTFTMQILSRMNTTWQGQIDWLDGREKAAFKSALQFVELVDERVRKNR